MSFVIKLPPQKIRYNKKDKEWRERCVNQIDGGISYLTNREVRRSVIEKTINGQLYDGVLNMRDVLSTIDTDGTLKSYVPKKIQHKPVMRPKIELLVGEATKEPFEWGLMVTDPNSISQKQENKKKDINNKVTKLLEADYKDEELAAKIKELGLYFKYTWKDIKEVRASKILKHYNEKLKLDAIFIDCLLDKLVYGEEIMMFDIVAGAPIGRKLDPKRVHALYSSNSNRISDADIIIIEEYWSPGRLIDTYYDTLSEEDVEKITSGSIIVDGFNQTLQQNVTSDGILIEGLIDAVSLQNPNLYQINKSTVDIYGNLRHLKALWRSQKLVFIVKGIDPVTGDRYERIMSEEYKPNIELGETVEKVWVEEWWEGSKIGNEVFTKMGPRPVQFNSIDNASKGHPGIVGYVNSISEGKVVSFLSKMKPYQYLYDIVWDRLMDGLRKDMGKILELDMAKIPTGWTVETWMHYAYKGGIAFVDSFKEATKGVATGTLAGTFNTTGKVLDMSNGNYIQQQVNLLEFIKKELSDIVGITPQRAGAVQASAAVGATERSVMGSSNATAYEFYTHQQFKLECLQILMETCKAALRGNKLLAQNILSDFSTEVFEVDGDELLESDYGIFITVSKKYKEIEADLERYSQAFMQNGGSFATIFDIVFSDSMAEKRRKVELAEYEMKQERQQQAQAQQQAQQEALQSEMENKQADRELKMYEIDTNNATKLLLGEMQQDTATMKVESDSDESKEELMVRLKEMQLKIDAEYAKIKAMESKKVASKK